MEKTIKLELTLVVNNDQTDEVLALAYLGKLDDWFFRQLNGERVLSAHMDVGVLTSGPEVWRGKTVDKPWRGKSVDKPEPEHKYAIGACRSFIIEKAPRGSLQRPGQRYSGVIKAIRGQRITLEDASGFRYTVNRSAVSSK